MKFHIPWWHIVKNFQACPLEGLMCIVLSFLHMFCMLDIP